MGMVLAWNDNNFEGKAIRYGTKKLYRKLRHSDDVQEILEITKAIAYVAQIKATIAEKHELAQRVSKIEESMGLAQKHVAYGK